MTPIFWLPFTAGSVYSLRKELKKPLEWKLPTAFMTTVTTIATLRLLGDKEGYISANNIRTFPRTFLGAAIGTGTVFCFGHLLTKMAYPIFTDEMK